MAYYRKRGCVCKDKKKCKCNAKWSFTIDAGIDPKTGKRIQKTVSGFDRKTDAEEAAAALMLEIKSGSPLKASDIKFKDFADEWIKEYEQNDRIKDSSVRSRKFSLERLMPYLAHIKMKDVTRKMYQDALNDLKIKGKSDNTLVGVHSTGRMIFKKAVEYEIIKTDPTEYARAPKTKKTVEQIEKEFEEVKYLEKEELALFLNTASTQGLKFDYPIFLSLAYSGMRVGELCALKWKDIDFEEKTINITKTYYSETNRVDDYVLQTPKTKTSWRRITIEQVVLDELQKVKNEQNVLKMRYRMTYYDQDFVFVRTRPQFIGYPWNGKSIGTRMDRLLKLANLNKELTPHSLRHTHTSLLAEAEVGLLEIMDRLGHKDDQTTRYVYLHVTKQLEKLASQKFGDLMKNVIN